MVRLPEVDPRSPRAPSTRVSTLASTRCRASSLLDAIGSLMDIPLSPYLPNSEADGRTTGRVGTPRPTRETFLVKEKTVRERGREESRQDFVEVKDSVQVPVSASPYSVTRVLDQNFQNKGTR